MSTKKYTARDTVAAAACGPYHYKGSLADFWPTVQELCESRGGRPGLSVLMSFTVSVDVKQY